MPSIEQHQSHYIEPGILPVCDALNAIPEITTIYSCAGHWSRECSPFVMFDAPNDVALKIHRLLGYGHGDGSLAIVWWMQARFKEDGSLIYIIQTNDYRIPNSSWLPSRWWLWFKINDELKRLAKLISTIR